jgi:hypothetical protein
MPPKVAESKEKSPEIRRFLVIFGAAGRIRTADLILTNGTLGAFFYFLS